MDVKITVQKIVCHEDLMAQYENPISHACFMEVGREFLSKNGQMPPDFCESAWESVRPFAEKLSQGEGNFFDGWMKDPYSAMISCNDGFRPVSFYLETVRE
ncbi:MAG: TIGR04076 family protein [Oscillospiraceae bacterium]|nr:TIGR04076 family protein [Oscillospiraceae bacterium]